jgi:predicted nuclease with TOPRIM domain
MGRDTVEVQNFLASDDVEAGERETLAARLASVEQAYEELLQRLRRYERERAELRARLERLLQRIGSGGTG